MGQIAPIRTGMRVVMQTVLCGRLGLDVPLIQAPMAGVSTPAMAAAVSNAGGLGSVALGALTAEQAFQALAETRALTSGPIAANVFTHPAPRRDAVREQAFLAALAPLFEAVGGRPPALLQEIYRSFNDDDAMLSVLLETRPEVVSLHFGPASTERMRQLKAAGCFVLATATSLAEARSLEASGVDALVLQGFDAGGHSGAFLDAPNPLSRGKAGLLRLVRSVSADVAVPVVAAGGLMDGADVREALMAGAAAAQLGTAFIDCAESVASPTYRAALSGADGTRLTSLISGRPARGLASRLLDTLEAASLEPPDYPVAYDAVKQLVGVTGDPEFAVMWAGAGASRSRTSAARDVLEEVRVVLKAADDPAV